MVMEFKAKSLLKPTFVWQKGDEIVAESDRYKIITKEVNSNEYYAALEIIEPKKEKDAGQFVCTAKNESGKLTATFSVKFEGNLLNIFTILSNLSSPGRSNLYSKASDLAKNFRFWRPSYCFRYWISS
jgi:hypothetical protein